MVHGPSERHKDMLLAAATHLSAMQRRAHGPQWVAVAFESCSAGLGHCQHSGMSDAAAQAGPPLCVVHGPFGAGKSTLLVAAVHLFLAQRSAPGPLRGCRVAVAAHTNAAVDRVMCGLLESGITGDHLSF